MQPNPALAQRLRRLLAIAAACVLLAAAPRPALAQETAASPFAGATVPLGAGLALTLAPDGAATLSRGGPGTAAAVMSGAWLDAGDHAEVRLDRSGSAAFETPLFLEVAFVDGVLQVTTLQLSDFLFDRVLLSTTVGVGQAHPAMPLAHVLLANVPYLNYKLPTGDLTVFTEDARRALATYQEIEGLTPSGVLDPATLLDLLNPIKTIQPTSPVEITVRNDVVNLRSGPGTNYPVLDRVYAGQRLDVIARHGEGAADAVWLQVCCAGVANVWLRSDLGVVEGALARVPEAASIPPPPAAPAPSSGARVAGGQPLLADLPAYTPEGSPVVYLTFDDGPSGGWTQQVLDLLAQYDARATFFVIGQQVEGGAGQVRAAAQSGHYIANHTWDHVNLTNVDGGQFLDEVERTRQSILRVAGDLFTLDRDVRYLRPPYGAISAAERQQAADLGYAVVLWDVDPQDWRRPGVDAIVANVVANVFPGAIVLMHDGGGERSQSIAALAQILERLSGQGYKFHNIFGR